MKVKEWSRSVILLRCKGSKQKVTRFSLSSFVVRDNLDLKLLASACVTGPTKGFRRDCYNISLNPSVPSNLDWISSLSSSA